MKNIRLEKDDIIKHSTWGIGRVLCNYGSSILVRLSDDKLKFISPIKTIFLFRKVEKK